MLSIAGVLKRINAVVNTRSITSNDVFTTFEGATTRCLFADWMTVVTSTIPEATWAAYTGAAIAFTRYALARVIRPEMPWSDGLACALLGGWATFRASGEPSYPEGTPARKSVTAPTIRKEISCTD